MPTSMELVLVSLAAFRITRFFVYDSLFGANLSSGSRFSERLDAWAFTPDGDDRSWLRGKIADFATCPHCFGFWVSLACWLCWRSTDWADPAMVVFAVAGLQSLLSSFDTRGS